MERNKAHGCVVCHVTATFHTLRGATCHEVTYPVKLGKKKEAWGEERKKKREKVKKKKKKRGGGWQKVKTNVKNQRKSKEGDEARVGDCAQGSAADDTESCSISVTDGNNK